MELREDLERVNKNLSSQGVKFRIEKRGRLLNLRGPLPCSGPAGEMKIQRLSLKVNATQKGIEEAQKALQLVLLQIQHNQFEWKNWRTDKKESNLTKQELTNSEIIKDFEKAFFANSSKRVTQSGYKTTWSSAYSPYFRRLIEKSDEFNENFSTNLFLKTLTSYSENSRSRQQCSIALSALARRLGISLPENWSSYSKGYGLHKAKFRKLPTDKEIEETFLHIPNHRWKLVFGLMATYGLRNHEVFFTDLSSLKNNSDKIIRVLPNTKTGEHQVWPFHPEWVDRFKLNQLGLDKESLPKINTDLNNTTLQKVGKRVSEQFRRFKLNITPYDLRHAWAIRTIHIGLPDTVAARMMGHSVAIHTRTYHHWITRRDQQEAVNAALGKNTIN